MAPEIVAIPNPACCDYRETFRDSIIGLPKGAGLAYVCFSIAQAWPRVTPSAKQLMDRFGMERSTAYRYRAALQLARGEI